MENIYEPFQAALKYHLGHYKRGDRQKLADAAGISIGYLTHMTAGRRYGSEEVRRAIAVAMGFDSYETMLDFGRALLRSANGDEPNVDVPDFEIEKALADARKILESPMGPALKATIESMKTVIESVLKE